MKSRVGPLAESLAQACDGIGWMLPSSSWVNQVGLTEAFMLNTTVVGFGAVTLATWSGMPRPGVKPAQLAGLSLVAATIRSYQNSTSLEVIGWPSDHL